MYLEKICFIYNLNFFITFLLNCSIDSLKLFSIIIFGFKGYSALIFLLTRHLYRVKLDIEK